MRLKNIVRLILPALLGVYIVAGSLLQAQPADFAENLFIAPWHGSYVCNQGLTRLQLTIRPLAAPGGDMVEADFSFSADPDNPSVPKGSFRMTGKLDRAAQILVLKQERWLEQPTDPSYRMVDLAGKFRQDGNRALIQGQITTYGCQDFTVWQFFSTDQAGPQK